MVTMSPFVYWSVGILIIIGLLASIVFLFYAISRMVRNCFHIFHFWTDWEEYQDDFGWGGWVHDKGGLSNDGGKIKFRFNGIEIRKKRVCVCCQKMQDKFIERLYL